MKQLLLIDDQKEEVLFLNFLLKDHYGENNYKLNYAQDLKTAADILHSQKIDIILLDDKLSGGMSSADSIPILNQHAFNVPIVIITKNVESAHLKERRRLGTHKIADKFDLKSEIANGLLD